jgi:hypothetical protein
MRPTFLKRPCLIYGTLLWLLWTTFFTVRRRGNTHFSIVYVNGSKLPRLYGIGTLEESRPKPESAGWVRKVTRFGKAR